MAFDFIGLGGIGIVAFAATDIDDLFVLMRFFSTLDFKPRQVVIGQYLGIAALIAIGTIGVFLSLVVPTYIIALLGFAPIGIGIKKLLEIRKKENGVQDTAVKKVNLSILSVVAVTFANGGDNIAVYAPLFARYSTPTEISILAGSFMAMTGVWCALAYYSVSHPLVAARISRYGHVVLPFVLIGLGVYILVSGLS